MDYCVLTLEEVRSPFYIRPTKLIQHKSEIVRPLGFLQKMHASKPQVVVSFSIVAFDAGTNEVLPRFVAAKSSGHDVIGRHHTGLLAAILTLVIISFDDVLLG